MNKIKYYGIAWCWKHYKEQMGWSLLMDEDDPEDRPYLFQDPSKALKLAEELNEPAKKFGKTPGDDLFAEVSEFKVVNMNLEWEIDPS
jgi:hypothetical protein